MGVRMGDSIVTRTWEGCCGPLTGQNGFRVDVELALLALALLILGLALVRVQGRVGQLLQRGLLGRSVGSALGDSPSSTSALKAGALEGEATGREGVATTAATAGGGGRGARRRDAIAVDGGGAGGDDLARRDRGRRGCPS